MVLSVPSLVTPDTPVVFARCRRCGARFVINYQTPPYEAAAPTDAPLRFYVEQGAGIEFLARSVFIAAGRHVKNYLDIGCGFGFGPDMAKRIFGWNARGIDPGPLAAAGRKMLDIRIDSEILSAGERLDEGPYDAIVGMEVIEHISEPHGFLAAVRDNLSPAGVFILSTPNGRYLDTDPDGDMLIPVLSPGYHAVLYTADGLVRLLRKAGFRNVEVDQAGASLFAAASIGGDVTGARQKIDRGRYTGYLRARFLEAPAASAIRIGFGYRLFRCLTEDQSYQEALQVFGRLRNDILESHGLDIARPLDIAAHAPGFTIAFADVPGRFPFCLAGLLFFRGSVAADYECQPDQATGYFLAARFAAQMLLRSLHDIGISDGDLASLPLRAAHAAMALLGREEVSDQHDGITTADSRRGNGADSRQGNGAGSRQGNGAGGNGRSTDHLSSASRMLYP